MFSKTSRRNLTTSGVHRCLNTKIQDSHLSCPVLNDFHSLQKSSLQQKSKNNETESSQDQSWTNQVCLFFFIFFIFCCFLFLSSEEILNPLKSIRFCGVHPAFINIRRPKVEPLSLIILRNPKRCNRDHNS